jgi:hypothetical protein
MINTLLIGDSVIDESKYNIKDGLYYPKVASKKFHFPKGAVVYRDRVWRIGVLNRDIKPLSPDNKFLPKEYIDFDEGVTIELGGNISNWAAFDNKRCHRLLNGQLLPVLIFPD